MRIDSEEGVRACRQCYGSGECFTCSGRGMLASGGDGGDCRPCGGTGRCILCSGRGEVTHPADQLSPGPKPITFAR